MFGKFGFVVFFILIIEALLVRILAFKQAAVIETEDSELLDEDLLEDEHFEDELSEQTRLTPRGLFSSHRKICQSKIKIFNWKKAARIRREGWELCARECELRNPSLVGYCRRFRLWKNKCSCHTMDRLPLRLLLRLKYLFHSTNGDVELLRGQVGDYTMKLLRRYRDEVAPYRHHGRHSFAARPYQASTVSPYYAPPATNPYFATKPQSRWNRFWFGPRDPAS